MTDGKKRAARRTKSKTDNSGQRTLLHHFPRKRTAGDDQQLEGPNSSPAVVTDELPALSQSQLQDSRTDPASSDHERPPSSAPSAITIASNGSDKSAPTSPPDVRPEAPAKRLFPLFERAPAYKKPLSPLHPSVVDLDSEIIDITDDDEAPEHALVRKSQPSRPTRIFGDSNAPSSSAPASSSRRTLLISTEGTKHEPIIIDASPVRGPIRIFPPPRPNRQPSPAKKRNPNGSKGGMQAPLPDEQTQHARGPQTAFTSGSSNFGVRKEKRLITDMADSYASFHWERLLPKSTNSTNQSDDDLCHPSSSQATAPALESEFDAHRRLYPAISRFDTDTFPHQGFGAQTQPVDASQQHWNDKWRPRRAEQVLGNERRACYLRDWLSALRLHFDAPAAGSARSQTSSQTSGKGKQAARNKRKAPKRPQILREVKRSQKRRRDDELGWIVDDDDLSDEQPDFEYGDDDDDFLLTPQDAASPHREGEESPVPSEPFKFGDTIHNTILLTGPPGSGKTAAVYACAEELGWEVFEVYAGIGKRGGANLDTLIGDVGKNHLVQRPRLRAEEKRAADAEPVSQSSTQGAFQRFWDAGKKDADIQRLRRKGTRDGPLEVDEDSKGGIPKAHSQAPTESSDSSASGSQAVIHTGAIGTDDLNTNTTFRQSIVLFEEVDVLFKEDAGFWHAVVKFIKDCKRPVVMTCNDVTLVPTEDLPLQDILTFKPPPRPIAKSFLQGLCLAEGLRFDRQHLEHILTAAERRTFPHDRVGPDEPSTSHVDVRQCINQCQFGGTAMVSRGHSDAGYEARDNPLDSLFAVSGLGLERDSGSREEQLRHLDQRERNADSVSQLDAFCVLWDAWVLEASGSHADDQNGYNAIGCVTRDNVVAMPEYYRQDKEIVQAMIDIGDGAGGSEECARHEGGSYESQMEYALDGNVPRHAFILHRTTVFLEYEPWIRYIVREQMREREAEEERGKKGRQTRNSKRRGDEWVKMSEGQEGMLVRTGLAV